MLFAQLPTVTLGLNPNPPEPEPPITSCNATLNACIIAVFSFLLTPCEPLIFKDPFT